ncbi:MAG: TetR/AcrR family transcriptional regulator [Propionibacteriaceae bacterium]
MSPASGPSRREQRREETVTEIRSWAMEQVAEAGPEAVSLNAIARAMSMSTAAIYRYFDSRDALLADLVVRCYDSLADALENARCDDDEAADQVRCVARAYRRWALDHANAYRLIFQTTSGSGADLAPARTIPAATRSMQVMLAALAGLPSGASGQGPTDLAPSRRSELDAELRSWATRAQLPALPESILLRGLACWTRLHGIISLELGHHLGSVGVDVDLLYEAEINSLLS